MKNKNPIPPMQRDTFWGPVKGLSLPGNIVRLLQKGGVTTINRLMAMSEGEVLKIKGMGEVSLAHIKWALMQRGLRLTGTDPSKEISSLVARCDVLTLKNQRLVKMLDGLRNLVNSWEL